MIYRGEPLVWSKHQANWVWSDGLFVSRVSFCVGHHRGSLIDPIPVLGASDGRTSALTGTGNKWANQPDDQIGRRPRATKHTLLQRCAVP